MLLPEKHITLAESILGLGGFVLSVLDRPKTADQIYQRAKEAREDKSLPAFHDLDSIILAMLFLYLIGAIEATDSGAVRRCVS
jgi:hypothetical protein